MKPILNKGMVLEFIQEQNDKITPNPESSLTELNEFVGRQTVLKALLKLTGDCI